MLMLLLLLVLNIDCTTMERLAREPIVGPVQSAQYLGPRPAPPHPVKVTCSDTSNTSVAFARLSSMAAAKATTRFGCRSAAAQEEASVLLYVWWSPSRSSYGWRSFAKSCSAICVGDGSVCTVFRRRALTTDPAAALSSTLTLG
jgi:hypothetical protein